MIKIIDEIRKAIKNKTYLSALTLALTIPDICSQVETGKEDSDRWIYIDWFNKYIEKESFDLDIGEFKEQTFNGNMCYALRCKVLHNGNVELQQTSRNLKIELDHFQFTTPESPEYFYGYKYVYLHSEDGTKKTVTIIAIDYLCEIICEAAGNFYNNWMNKEDFLKHQINFI